MTLQQARVRYKLNVDRHQEQQVGLQNATAVYSKHARTPLWLTLVAGVLASPRTAPCWFESCCWLACHLGEGCTRQPLDQPSPTACWWYKRAYPAHLYHGLCRPILQRRELIGSVDFSQRQQKFAREQDVLTASEDITATLRRTKQLMDQNLEQTHGNISVLGGYLGAGVCVQMMPAVCGSCGRTLHLYSR